MSEKDRFQPLTPHDVQVLFDAFILADEAGLLGTCASDPCPHCTAAENAQVFLMGVRHERV